MKVYTQALNALVPKISPLTFKVFAVLANCVGYEELSNMTETELMKRTALDENSLQAGLNELEKLGVIKRIDNPTPRCYVLSEMYIRPLA